MRELWIQNDLMLPLFAAFGLIQSFVSSFVLFLYLQTTNIVVDCKAMPFTSIEKKHHIRITFPE